MLHVHGGSALLDKLRAAGLPGEFLEWCDVLCQGPTPAGLAPDAWRAARAAFLEEAYGPQHGRPVLDRLRDQDAALERALEHDEVVLWFGPDWFCQAILMYLLAWFGERELRGTRLSLVCIGAYRGIDDRRSCTPAFLSADALRDVFARRPPVSPAQTALARRAWRAFCDADPSALAELALRGDTSALPYLADGLRRHLEDFPAVHDGLGLTERRITALLQSGETDWFRLYEAFQELERRRWMTDLIFQAALQRVRAGDFAERWVGGVHCTAASPWYWDEGRERLVHRQQD